MNRKQRRSRPRSKSITRQAGLTYLTVVGVIGGSLGVVAPAQARQAPQNYLATDCDSLLKSLWFSPGDGAPATGLVATGGTLTADFSGTCDFAEGYLFTYASTITGPSDGSLTLNFTGTNAAFVTFENFAVSNLRFTQNSDAGIVSFIYGQTPEPDVFSFFSQQSIAPSITVANSTFSNATVESAIYAEGNLTVSDSVFRNLTAYNDGGAISSNGLTSISNTTFDSIETNGNGGAIYSDTKLVVSDSTFSNLISLGSSYPGDGGAIFSWNDSTITNSSFIGNSSTSRGGAVWHSGSLTVTGSSFTGNTSVSGGGAIRSEGIGPSIDNSTFVENNVIGPNDGAALSLSEGSVGNFISNSTFWNNGDRNSESIETEFSAFFFGNILANSSAVVELFATRGRDVTAEEVATNFDLGANLYTDDSFVDTTTGDGSSQLVSIDQLKLNDPALNTTGLINTGKTKTVAIGAGSVAKDYYSASSAGINPTGGSTIGDGAFSSRLATLDQRGVARPTGTRIDVGAFEFGEDPVVTPAVVAKATIAAQGINFAPGSSKLSKASKKKLRTLAVEIQEKGLKAVNIEGYTATLTKAAPNGKVLRVKLSKARATAVEKYLKQQFKKSGYSVTFTKSPKGAANPVKSNKTEKGRKDNRRVEIVID